MASLSCEDEAVNNENSDLFFVDGPPAQSKDGDEGDEQNERLSLRPQAPPLPGSTEALVEGTCGLWIVFMSLGFSHVDSYCTCY